MEVTEKPTELFRLLGLSPSNESWIGPDVHDLHRQHCGDDPHVARPDWNAVSDRLRTHPEEAKTGMKYRREGVPGFGIHGTVVSPLAMALFHRKDPVPFDVVRDFLRAAPEPLQLCPECKDGNIGNIGDANTVFWVPGYDGFEMDHSCRCSIPLVVAVENKHIGSNILKLLIESASSKALISLCMLQRVMRLYNLRDEVEQFKIVESILAHCPDSVTYCIEGNQYAGGKGEPPIYTALLYGSTDIVGLLLKELMVHPIDDSFSLLPPLDIEKKFYTFDRMLREASEFSLGPSLDLEGVADEYTNEKFSKFILCWKMIGAKFSELESFENYPIFHGAIQWAHWSCLTDDRIVQIMKCLITNYCEGYLEEVDPLGRTVLHVAASFLCDQFKCCKDGDTITLLANFVSSIATEPNSGACAQIPDQQGESPLHYAVKHGLHLDFGLGSLIRAYPEACARVDSDGLLPLHRAILSGIGPENGLLEIMRACPRAALSRDMHTGMHQFVIAAAPDMVEIGEPILDSVFVLLRDHPDAVMGGIRPRFLDTFLANNRQRHEREKVELLRQIDFLTERNVNLERENATLREASGCRGKKRTRGDNV